MRVARHNQHSQTKKQFWIYIKFTNDANNKKYK